ncbi:S8 family peptidase [Fischerella thermalis]|jgi:subtilisin family serine protease|uniref:S8 family peptidase n=1 Tax=Fischerella thermalis TaxID=372787 RepID=UPI000C7FC59D|nr:S8 family peptidase [Fischerella thermalis]PLZ07696.1 serine protease [Fischerella thermalis WC1110]PLZ10855.1 serine protease [Fischerella thermalis WC119]PLZ27858.1 serine protease [Fischerella thermalis WC341]PLZ38704.1 serine protease [Fischerella thermalis WC538]PLZ44472.1 serine protease [Fischerella thermalis WC527]
MQLQFESTDIFADIDPRLQRLLERKSRGITIAATTSTEKEEVAVIAKVNNLKEWLSMNEVYPGADLGSTPNGERIVTGRIPVSRIEHIKQSDCVVSLKPAQALKPAININSPATVAIQDLCSQNSLEEQGSGVVVGIIDVGCDFAHKNFRNPDGSTRLLAFWNQDGHSNPKSPYGYGQEYKRDEINQALSASDPYAALGYELEERSHGTHVMDIAVGNGQGSGLSGVAPGADIVFVQLSQNEYTPLIENGEKALESCFGDTVALLEAMRYIFDIAGDRPCVINISLGLYGGPHDGTTLVEQGIDALVSEKPNRAIVIAAGNSYDTGIHASGIVWPNQHFDLQWQIPHRNPRQKEIEIWYDGGDRFQLEIIAPDGSSLGRVDLGENGEVVDTEDNTIIFFTNRHSDPNNGDNVICVFMEPDLPGGIWTLRLHGIHVINGKFHAWIEREDHSQTCFVPPHDNTHTLNTIACGYKSIVVGSYDNTKTNKPLSFFSSSGPTRDGRQKPDLIAPGHHIWAAASRTGTQVVRMSGTSMAAPVVTGAIALIFAEALAHNQSLTIEEIRELLAASTQKNFPTHSQPERYGYGAIDLNAVVLAVQDKFNRL